MGVKEIISGILERQKAKKEKFKEMEEDYLLRKKLEDRMKSSNERELEKYLKDQREKQIKIKVDKIHKQQNHNMWHGNQILKSDYNILHDDKPILKQQNIFKGKSNSLKGGMFFK